MKKPRYRITYCNMIQCTMLCLINFRKLNFNYSYYYCYENRCYIFYVKIN